MNGSSSAIATILLGKPMTSAGLENHAVAPLPLSEVKAQTLPAQNTSQFLTPVLGLEIAATLVIGVWTVFDSLCDLARWGLRDAESSQVILAPVVVAWIAWVRRERWAKCSGRGRWVGVVIMAAGWTWWFLGFRYQWQVVWHAGGIMFLAGLVLSFLGKDVFWNFLPAWTALIFLIPVPGRLRLQFGGPLERVTAMMTQYLAEAVGIESVRSGNQLNVNGVDVAVAEACNGLRLVFTLVMACYVFAFNRPFRWWVRLIVLIASPAVAIVCNVIRLVPTIWVFGHASQEFAEKFHDWTGWAMLLVAFGLLVSTASLFEWLGVQIERDDSTQGFA